MINFTIFDPSSGLVIAHHSCSHEEEVWHQPQIGQGIVSGWKPSGWVSAGDEGFVRLPDGFVPITDWIEQHSPDVALTHQPTEE
jgi:hypothetical protein